MYAPYNQPEINQIYDLLFCDDLMAFSPKPGEELAPWQSVLFGGPVDAERVRTLAEDTTAEGRIRALAYNWLRAQGQPVPPKTLLGVIVEVPLDGGLDVLAAFSDHGVRYINQTGKLAVIEGGLPETDPIVVALLAAAQPVIARIGPSDQERLPPPRQGNFRLTFLVSDGLYFGEGPMPVMQRDPLAGPVINQATQLLQMVVDKVVK